VLVDVEAVVVLLEEQHHWEGCDHTAEHHPVHPTQSCNNSYMSAYMTLFIQLSPATTHACQFIYITQFIQPSPATTHACQFTSPCSSNPVIEQLMHVSLHDPVHPTQSCNNSCMSVYMTLFIQISPATTLACQFT